MNITILGTGGVGGYFGGCLAKAGNIVTFVARGKHLEAIQQNGLQVKSTKGDFTIFPAKASDDYLSVKDAELVLVCTKAWQVKDVAQSIAPFIGPNCMVMPLQNGILAADELAEYLPAQNIVGGLCRLFSLIEAPGIIMQRGGEPTIVFGELTNEKSSRTARLKQLFDEAGINNIWTNDIKADLWKKFIMIASSALLAITKTNYGQLRNLQPTREMLIDLYTEIYHVGIAAGINLSDNIVEKTMQAVDAFPPDSTSSLTRDVWEGKPSEIEYQNGTIVNLGKKLGVPTPINQFVYNTVLPMEMKARGIAFPSTS
jgi:2-dehydropantoate 2-reductase